MKSKGVSFEDDLKKQLEDPEFAALWIMSSIIEKDLDSLPIALGVAAKAHGISKLSKKTGISRRTLYKAFDKTGNPSFELILQIIDGLGMELEIKLKKPKKRKAS